MIFEEEIDSFSLQDDNVEYTYSGNSSANHESNHSLLVVDDRDTQSYPFETIYFDFDKSTIRNDQKAALGENIKLAQKAAKQGRTIVIEGHTCGFGSKAHNQLLSLNRAQMVANLIKSQHVSEDRVKVVGRGSDMMLVASGDKPQQAPNRRVEIYVDVA
jgi:outer membrane protein OmpA-like peptidoglycan-associated protein